MTLIHPTFLQWKQDCPNQQVSLASPFHLMVLLYMIRKEFLDDLNILVQEGLRFDCLFQKKELHVPLDWILIKPKHPQFVHPIQPLLNPDLRVFHFADKTILQTL